MRKKGIKDMSKFKVGDRVIYSGDSSYYVTKNYIGKKGNISALVPHGKQMFYNVIFDDGTLGREVYEDNLSSISSEPSKIYTEQAIKVIEPNHYGNRRVISVNQRITTGDELIDISIIPMMLSKDDIADMIDVLQQIHEVMR